MVILALYFSAEERFSRAVPIESYKSERYSDMRNSTGGGSISPGTYDIGGMKFSGYSGLLMTRASKRVATL